MMNYIYVYVCSIQEFFHLWRTIFPNFPQHVSIFTVMRWWFSTAPSWQHRTKKWMKNPSVLLPVRLSCHLKPAISEVRLYTFVLFQVLLPDFFRNMLRYFCCLQKGLIFSGDLSHCPGSLRGLNAICGSAVLSEQKSCNLGAVYINHHSTMVLLSDAHRPLLNS